MYFLHSSFYIAINQLSTTPSYCLRSSNLHDDRFGKRPSHMRVFRPPISSNSKYKFSIPRSCGAVQDLIFAFQHLVLSYKPTRLICKDHQFLPRELCHQSIRIVFTLARINFNHAATRRTLRMPFDHREDAYQACGSESTATNHSEATEDNSQDIATEDLRNLSNDPISSPRSTDSQSLVACNAHDDTHLCQRCHELEFESKFISASNSEFGFEIDRGTLDSACILCKLFARAVPSHPAYFHIEGLSDPSDDYDELFVGCTPSLHTPGLETYRYSKGLFGLVPSPQKSWSLDLAKIDFDTLRKKFEHCKAKHTKTCCPGRVPVKNLRVFNCATRKLEQATIETEYAALSYV